MAPLLQEYVFPPFPPVTVSAIAPLLSPKQFALVIVEFATNFLGAFTNLAFSCTTPLASVTVNV